MAPQGGITATVSLDQIIQAGVYVVAFFLALGVKDLKKSADKVPGMEATLLAIEKELTVIQRTQEEIFRRIGELEKGQR